MNDIHETYQWTPYFKHPLFILAGGSPAATQMAATETDEQVVTQSAKRTSKTCGGNVRQSTRIQKKR
jgi:hypothetical protein